MDEWDAQKILDMYILDYMKRKNMHTTAEIFAQEANVCDKPVVINSPEGFLKEWWDIFYDVFASRNAEARGESSSQVQGGNAEAGEGSSSQANMAMGNMMQNVCPTIPRPGMIQLGDLIQNLSPTMPKPAEMNQQMMNQEMINQLMMGQLPNTSDFSMMQGQQTPLSPMLAAAQMHEQDRLKLPAGDMNPSPLLDLETLSRMLPPSGSSSHLQQQAPQQPPQQPPQQVARENRRVINLGRPIPRSPTSYGTSKASHPSFDPPDAGKNKGVKLTASTGWPLTGAGSVLPTMSPPALNPFIPTPDQQQQSSAFASQHILSEVVAEASGKKISSAPESSANVGNAKSVNDDSIWKDLLEMFSVKQPREQQVSPPVKQTAENMIMSKTPAAAEKQTDQLNDQCHNESGRDAEGETPVGENVEPFLSHNDEAVNNMSTVFPRVEHRSSPSDKIEQQGFSFSEFCSLHGTKNKLLCCHFSSHGKLLASAGHERKVIIWNVESYATVIVEGHSRLITDIRFRPNSTVFATSSFDRSVQIWDASRPSKYLFMLNGHAEPVTSIDFHPTKVDLLSSCDSNDEIRIWNINQCHCTRILKGGSRQIRFQPRLGGLLAAATGNVINLIDVETNNVQCQLEGHAKEVHSICWDISGKYIASVSEDSARIWSTVLGGKCIHELHSSGNKFESCTFHPGYAQLLVIGSYQSLELWNPTERNKTWTYPAHNGLISSLDASPQTETIASASHDQLIKLWK